MNNEISTIPINTPITRHTNTPITDQRNRPLHDLRISVTDRCNFRCRYCMPKRNEGSYRFIPSQRFISFENILHVVDAAAALGVTKIRITGGEPLLRPNLSTLIRGIARIEGITDIALTTNGSFLADYAAELKAAGLSRITVSLDTLDPRCFAKITGQSTTLLTTVLAGIHEAERAGFSPIKINVVIRRGKNESAVMHFVERFRNTAHIVRFIEYMDVGTCNAWNESDVVPSTELFEKINARYPLIPAAPHYPGEVACRYRYADGAGEIGFISSITKPFCSNCSRLRLSSDGKLYTCLFADHGYDLKKGTAPFSLKKDAVPFLKHIWITRTDRYSDLRTITPHQPSRTKTEMFKIGG